MALQIDYNMTVDLVNPDNNISSDYPLVQGTLPRIELLITDNNSVIDIDSIDNVNVVVASYCKLDNAPMILPIEKTEVTLGTNDQDQDVLIITGKNITSHAGKCALILKFTNSYTTYSTPLYYYVNANPMAGIEFVTE